MNKATSALIAAVAAFALSGGAYAQAGAGAGGGAGGGADGGGSGHGGSTASPANQANQPNDATSGYGTPGMSNSESGRVERAPNSGLPSGTNSTSKSAPKSNNTLATPSTVSPAANGQ